MPIPQAVNQNHVGEDDDISLPKNLEDFAGKVLAFWNHLSQEFRSPDRSALHAAYERTSRQIARHPWLAGVVLTSCMLVAVPFALFVTFACVTVLITFCGFLLVEGTLITMASVLLFSFIGVILLVAFCLVTVALAATTVYTLVSNILNPELTAVAAGWKERRQQQRQQRNNVRIEEVHE